MIHRRLARFMKAMARCLGLDFVYDAVSDASDGKTSATVGLPLLSDAGSVATRDDDGQQWICTEGMGQHTALLGELARMARRN
jgi:hypothetical protein